MDSHSLTRKDFITLTLTLIGGSAVAAGCSSSNASSSDGGAGGSTGSGGSGAGGAGTGTGGKTSTDAAADGAGDARPDTANSCADPLPASQTSDGTGHSHSMDIPVSTLAMTDRQLLLSGPFPTTGSGGHFHEIALSPADLGTLRGGGSVTVTSNLSGTPEHTHVFMVACHSSADAGPG